jgi:hypothetical protein
MNSRRFTAGYLACFRQKGYHTSAETAALREVDVVENCAVFRAAEQLPLVMRSRRRRRELDPKGAGNAGDEQVVLG